jgi:hypothetical protein
VCGRAVAGEALADVLALRVAVPAPDNTYIFCVCMELEIHIDIYIQILDINNPYICQLRH